MIRNILVIACSLLFASSLTAQVPASAVAVDKDAVLATIGATTIRESDFHRFLDGNGPDAKAETLRDPAARREALDAYLQLSVLVAKAHKDGLDANPVYLKARELMEMKTLVQLFQERNRHRLAPESNTTDAEVKNYYDTHTNEFRVPPGFTARQILVYVKGNPAFPDQGLEESAAAVRAQTALTKLRAGESWESVAKQFSDDTATNQRGGLMENARFGYFPAEMESALRVQEPGRPGEPVKSQFGYHVIQVERRSADGEREPLEKVRELIARRLSDARITAAQKLYLDRIRTEVDLKETDAAGKDAFLLDATAVKPEEVLATIGSAPIREADFQWFVRDAYRPEQRAQAFSKPGSRRAMLTSYLDLRAIEARARQVGLDKEAAFAAIRTVAEMKLLAEFLQERDKTTPWTLPGSTESARNDAWNNYLSQLQSEVGFRARPPSTAN